MIPRPTTRRGPRARRVAAALLAALLVLLATACSDAPTEKEIAMADDGFDPSIVPIFTTEELLTTVTDLGTVFLLDHPGITFQYTTKDPETLGQRVRDGVHPALWIDRVEVLEPFVGDSIAEGGLAPVGDDVVQFIVDESYTGPDPTLEMFGPGTFPARTGLCEVTAPCGRAAHDILTDAGVTPDPDLTFPTGREVISGFVDAKIDTAIVYRSDAARLYTRFLLQPLPDPASGAKTYGSLRLRGDDIGETFQGWIASSPDADAILVKRGFRPRPGARVP